MRNKKQAASAALTFAVWVLILITLALIATSCTYVYNVKGDLMDVDAKKQGVIDNRLDVKAGAKAAAEETAAAKPHLVEKLRDTLRAATEIKEQLKNAKVSGISLAYLQQLLKKLEEMKKIEAKK